MNKLLKRLSIASAVALTAGMLVAPGVLAQEGTGNSCSISDNGAFSKNKCKIKVVNKTTTVQVNNAKVKNNVTVVSNTGGNKASFNTGGSVSITTGDSNVNVAITNTVNGNTINPAP